MRVLVSGAGGMIGSEIVDMLRGRGDEVGALIRHGEPGPLDVAWDPAKGELDEVALAAGEFDVVAHLAGESIMGRWTDEKRARILDSRVDGTALLARALARLERQPSVFVVASATGLYGDRGEELLTEDSARGDGFLADVVEAWETAAKPARDAGIRTTNLRMSAVYSPDGGALKAQLPAFKLGAGGKTGSGSQWTPWIGVHEAARIWLFAMDHDALEGPVNVVGPDPARNVDIAKALGRVLGRPSFMPAPVPLMKLALGGELVDTMLLASQKVVPARLEGAGYEFVDRTIEDALRRELDRPT